MENAYEIRRQLEALVGKVPGLLSAEVGFSFTDGLYDVCLVTALTDLEALSGYQEHPEHRKVKEFVCSVVADRACCDYVIGGAFPVAQSL